MSREGRFLLLFGTETGQAKAISEIIRDKALEKGLLPELHCFSQFEKKFHLEKEPVVVIVVSTTGDGEPPEAVRKAWRKLRKKTLPSDHLCLCHFALLGLGDTNYDNFCNMGKMLNERLLQLGAKSFYPPGFADDAVGLEEVVEPWMEGLWEPLHNILSPTHCTTTTNTASLIVTNGGGPVASSSADERSDLIEVANAESRDTRTCTDVLDSGLEIVTSTKAAQGPSVTVSGEPTGSVKHADNMEPTGNNSTSGNGDIMRGASPHGHEPASKPATNLTPRESEVMSSVPGAANTTVVSTNRVPSDKLTLDDPTDSPSHQPPLNVSANGVAAASLGKRLTELSLDPTTLSLPTLPPAYLEIALKKPETSEYIQEFPFHKVPYRIHSSISMATIIGSRPLTNEGAVKRTLELEFALQDDVRYEPGDALGFVCPNSTREVQWLLERLNLSSQAQYQVALSLLKHTTKKNPSLPSHVPDPCTVQQLFTHSVDIRCTPKKAFLGLLATYCSNKEEERRLKELASRQGAKQYTQLFTELRTDFLDVLHFFPSCQPPLERLVESLPRLQPRYYSATSSPLDNHHRLRIMFNVETLPPRSWGEEALGLTRRGLATGWFASLADSQLPTTRVQVPIFMRAQNPFRLPSNPYQPIVMIGPGTGVGPFIGFLDHLSRQGVDRAKNGKTWLFFGCRHPDLDYLYKQEIEHFQSTGTLTKLNVTHSRHSVNEQGLPRYVQDSIREEWRELGRWILEEDAAVYMCGDVLTMLKDIQGALEQVLERCTSENASSTSAKDILVGMKEDGRFLVDMWI